MSKKGEFIVDPNKKNELISMRPVTGWHVCMDDRKLYSWIKKDYFPMPFIDQIFNRLVSRYWYYFHDGYQLIMIVLLLTRNNRRPLHFHKGHLRSRECHLICVIHPQIFSVAWCLSFLHDWRHHWGVFNDPLGHFLNLCNIFNILSLPITAKVHLRLAKIIDLVINQFTWGLGLFYYFGA